MTHSFTSCGLTCCTTSGLHCDKKGTLSIRFVLKYKNTSELSCLLSSPVNPDILPSRLWYSFQICP